MTRRHQFFRAAIAALALCAAGASSGHAAAKNHDCQAFRSPTASNSAVHDRAPGPNLKG